LAQVVGFDRHRYSVNAFASTFGDARSWLISIADACAKTGAAPQEDLEQPSALGKILLDFSEFARPVPTSLVPTGFPDPKDEDVEAMAIAADYWEEQGNLKNAERLRNRVDCILSCHEILDDAVSQWCFGHPEEPATDDVLGVIVDNLYEARFIVRPYGVQMHRTNGGCW
jgi:hypothetical protein